MPVRVYYDPRDPAVAFTAPAENILAVQLPAWIGGSLLGSLFGMAAARAVQRFRDWLAPTRHSI
jgi:hypothetical protein